MGSKWIQIKDLDEVEFRRLTGVKKATFGVIAEILKAEEVKKVAGRPNSLTVKNRALLTLEYWREYRTFFHIAQSYGVSEATAWRIVQDVENKLIRSGKFSLPGKKALLDRNNNFEIVLIDCSESPVERPKKRSQ